MRRTSFVTPFSEPVARVRVVAHTERTMAQDIWEALN